MTLTGRYGPQKSEDQERVNPLEEVFTQELKKQANAMAGKRKMRKPIKKKLKGKKG